MKANPKVSKAKIARVVALLKAAPNLSDRAIAKVADVDGKTVAKIRREIAAGAETDAEVRTEPPEATKEIPPPIDPVRVLEEIAADKALPAAARVAACKELRRAPRDPENPPAPASDPLSDRALSILNRPRLN